MDIVYLKKVSQEKGIELAIGRSKELPIGKPDKNGKPTLVDVGPEAYEAFLKDGFKEIEKSEYDKLRAEKVAAKNGKSTPAPAPVKETEPEKKPAKRGPKPKTKKLD